MVAAVQRLISDLFGPALPAWAFKIHLVMMSVVAAAGLWPGIAAIFRRIPRAEPEIEWIRLWRCPRCSTFNRRSFTVCNHCNYALPAKGWERWISLRFSEKLQKIGRRFSGFYKFAGWVLYYGLTALVFWGLRFQVFHQDPLQEWWACVAMALWLIALQFFQRALRPRLKSPLSAVMDVAAGLVVSVVLLFSVLLWLTPFPPNRPLAVLRVSSAGSMEFSLSGRMTVRLEAPAGYPSQIQIGYGVLAWPFAGFRKIFFMDVSGTSLIPDWMRTFTHQLAPYGQKNGWLRPRLVLRNQTLPAVSGGTYAVYEPNPGAGLLLRAGLK